MRGIKILFYHLEISLNFDVSNENIETPVVVQ